MEGVDDGSVTPNEVSEETTRDEDVAVIVNYLTALRKQYGLSQWDLAIRTGTSQSHISETETGATPNTRSDFLARMCRSLGLRLTVSLDPEITPEMAAQAILVARHMSADLGVRIGVAHA